MQRAAAARNLEVYVEECSAQQPASLLERLLEKRPGSIGPANRLEEAIASNHRRLGGRLFGGAGRRTTTAAERLSIFVRAK